MTRPLPAAHHSLPAHDVLLLLASDPARGLAPEEAEERLRLVGPNALPAAEGTTLLQRVLRQLQHPLVLVLIVAGTVALALGEVVDAGVVFGVVVVYGFMRNGAKFLKLFVPSGIPVYILPLVTLIEIISFLSRPLSHSLRLFGNILAGHIVLKVFGGMVVALLGAGAWGFAAILPFGMAVALTGLEFLVAALQAFVFAVLTCVYLHDAMHPGH